MGQPILNGYHFKIERKVNKGKYSMASYDIYRDYYSFGYLYAGNRIIITPDRTCTVSPGTIVFIHKHMPHRTTGKLDIPYENFSIKFRECVLDRVIQTVGRDKIDSLFSQIAIHLSQEADQKVRLLLNQIEEEWNQYHEYSNLMIECMFTQILLLIIKDQRQQLRNPLEQSKQHTMLLDAIQYLETHYLNDPSIEETAHAIHISTSYLSRIFKTEMDSSYSKYLLRIKIGHAQKLLATTNISITEIASQTGFKNSQYFSEVFKKSVGESPIQYRKEMRFRESK